mmetsp:Transcript_77422/g.177283  ORF Transcript_77422/g.177283 Transcript_77422/m.177283 type:complete len:321 (-) Transcript_77422:110-1072(-)
MGKAWWCWVGAVIVVAGDSWDVAQMTHAERLQNEGYTMIHRNNGEVLSRSRAKALRLYVKKWMKMAWTNYHEYVKECSQGGSPRCACKKEDGYKGLKCDISNRWKDFALRDGGRVDASIPQLNGLRYLSHGPWRQIVADALNTTEFEMTHASVIVAYPRAEVEKLGEIMAPPGWIEEQLGDQKWHRDGYIAASKGNTEEAVRLFGRPYGMSVFVALQDIDVSLGPTQVAARSHLAEALETEGADYSTHVAAPMRAGGVLIYDMRTIHRGLRNASPKTTRWMLQLNYATSPEVDNYRDNYGDQEHIVPEDQAYPPPDFGEL